MALGPLVRGDDWKFTITVLDSDGVPVDIALSAVWLTFKSKAVLGQPDSNAEFQVKNLSIAAGTGDDPDNIPATGIVVLRAAWDSAGAAPPDKSLMPIGSYNYDVQYKDVTSGAITTIASGNVSVSEQVTEATT